MKVCACCSVEKSKDGFYKNKRRKDGLSSRCKACDDASNRNARYKKPELTRSYRVSYMTELVGRINAWKSEQGCRCCSETAPCCLELHHTDPSEKEDHPSSMRTSWDRFMKEAEKCVVVCSNCHKKIHYGLLTLPMA